MLPVHTTRARTSARLAPEAKVKASIGIAVSRLKASFNNFIKNQEYLSQGVGLVCGLCCSNCFSCRAGESQCSKTVKLQTRHLVSYGLLERPGLHGRISLRAASNTVS